ncbi:MAG TPA: SDR family oxidoreductase [Aliidongia sp.]|nr:SDR family oxidoreductase [Aliidongia sp.]
MSGAKGKAVVTGASAGIGMVYADRLAGRGYDLVLVARRADRLAAVAEELKAKHGVSVETVVADLGKAADLDRVASHLAGDQRVTLLVNNAGTSTLAPTVQISSADLDAMNNVNVVALSRLTLAVLPGFKARDQGTIINIGSILGFQSLPVSSLYSGTKSYVLSFTRGLQAELANSKIVVQLVVPAATATDLWELSGVPLSALNPSTVMSVEDCVDAALSGLDQGELVTLPSVENATALLAAYDAARNALLGGAQSGKPASRYSLSR